MTEAVASRVVTVRRLGRVPYGRGLEIQERARRRAAGRGDTGDQLLLLEHDPVFTLGRNARAENVLFPAELLRAARVRRLRHGPRRRRHLPRPGPGRRLPDPRPLAGPARRAPLRPRPRGGDDPDLRRLRRRRPSRIAGLTGTWVGREKIGAIGVRISRWVTSHGFAFNVSTDLAAFDLIVPCGIRDKGVTSLERLLGPAGAARRGDGRPDRSLRGGVRRGRPSRPGDLAPRRAVAARFASW